MTSLKMQYGLEQAREVISAAGPDKERFLPEAMELLELALTPGVLAPYVVSFCERGDLLSQWRAYGDRGAGFSVQFDFAQLSSLFGGTSVFKVTYDPKMQRGVLASTIEEYLSIRLRWVEKCPDIEHRCSSELAWLLLNEFATFKDPGFSEEQEWRLIRFEKGSWARNFRPGRFGITPYIELAPSASQRLPIKKVVQGPTVDRSLAKRSVEMLLADTGYVGVEVEVSTIPLR